MRDARLIGKEAVKMAFNLCSCLLVVLVVEGLSGEEEVHGSEDAQFATWMSHVKQINKLIV